MIKVNENNLINAKDIYSFVEVKTRFNDWINNCIDYADLKENKDFYKKLSKSTGGRPAMDYEFTIIAAKEICIVSATLKAKELRRWLISLSEKVENLELITVKQAAFAFKVINCLKYVENQKACYSAHQTAFIETHKEIDSKFIYSEFAKYRANIVGWNKQQTNEAIERYLSEHVGYNKAKLRAANMQTQLSVFDISEAIKTAVLDILYANNTEIEMAQNFASLCKNLSSEMKIEPSKNETNLFQSKEKTLHVKSISLKQLSE
jgi:phage anti-repressor protein